MSYERTFYENGQVVDDAEIFNKFDSALYDLFQELNGRTVWENESPENVFNATVVSIECERTVKSYEVLYMVGNSIKNVLTTGKIPLEKTSYLQALNTHVYWRTVAVTQENSAVTLTISACTRRTIASSPASSTQNGFVIPLAIKFYYE